jgi:ZIP family zinc transporter
MIGVAIMLDNVVEGMSMAEIIRAEEGECVSIDICLDPPNRLSPVLVC